MFLGVIVKKIFKRLIAVTEFGLIAGSCQGTCPLDMPMTWRGAPSFGVFGLVA